MYDLSHFPRLRLAHRIGLKVGTDYTDSELINLLNDNALVVENCNIPEMLQYKQNNIFVAIKDLSPETVIRPLAQILLGHHLLPDVIRNNYRVLEGEVDEFIAGYNYAHDCQTVAL